MEEERAFFEVLLTKSASFPDARKELSLQNLRNYKDILVKMAGMDTVALTTEIEKAELEAIALQEPSRDQQGLLDILQGIRFFRKLFNLSLTVNEFKTGDSHFSSKNDCPRLLQEWDRFLQKISSAYGLPYVPFDAAAFLKRIPEARAFYQTAIAREEAMLKNAIVKIDATGADRAAFVMGGFHSRVIFQALKDRDYTVLLVSPRFKPEDEKTAQEQYLKMLKYKWTGKSEIPASEFKSPNSKFGSLDPKQV